MYKMYKIYDEYELEDIWDSIVFAKESEAGYLSGRRSASLVWQKKHLGACISSLTPKS